MKRAVWAGIWGAGVVGWILFLGTGNRAADDTVRIADAPALIAADSIRPDSGARTDTSGVTQTPARKTAKTRQQTACINVNTSTADRLTELPGIGPVIAGRIAAWRDEHGTFRVPEDLIKVKGIGPARLAGIVDHICF
jgi:competence protein ComEA